MAPFFSVIIPTLNEEKYIQRILKDLINQRTKNFEVIIVDGVSTDKTKEIILSYKDRLPINFITLKKPNLSKQKNLGAQQAVGQYLLFIDADMSVGSLFTSVAEKQILIRKGLLFLPSVFPIEKNEFPEVNMIFPVLNRLVELSQTLAKPFSAGPSMIWEKNTFNFIGGFDDIFGEDHQIIRKAYLWGIKVKTISNIKIKFSLRRMRKEGRARLIYHFLRSHLYLLFNEKLEEKIFKYEMGGHLYKKEIIEKKPTFLKAFRKLLKEF